MRTNTEYQSRIQLSKGPETEKEQKQLERQMGFSYRQCIGELIYALTICRVNISVAIITLIQLSINLAQIHLVKHIFTLQKLTKRNGLTYWRTSAWMELPLAPNPTLISKEGQLDKFDNQWNALKIIGACNGTWVSDRKYQRLMGGVLMMLAGPAVYLSGQIYL